MLERRLAVPKIYLEPPSSIISADVLAVDRAGVGDLHAVEIKSSSVATIITIKDRGEEPPIAELSITPERFRVDAVKLSKIERNLINNKKVRPDIKVRI